MYAVKLSHHNTFLDPISMFLSKIFCACEGFTNASRYTVRCRYNAVKFLSNIHKRQPIARPLGRGMVCHLWIQHLVDIPTWNL